MLSDAFVSDSWPSGKATFAITPGGFIRTPLPRSYCGRRGWESRKRDLDKLIPHAQAAVAAVVHGEILDAARQRTRFLTLGVDLNGDRNKEDRIRGNHTCRRKALPTAEVCASGIAFWGNPKPVRRWKPWQTLEATQAATASGKGISDVVIRGYGR